MRKNTENVFNAWLMGRSEKSQKSVWTDGVHIYSYNTLILVTPDDVNDPYRFNTNRYSVTTSCQQRGIKILCARNNIRYVEKGL